ncbi:helix-turn-helix domain-containing protein [Nocardioides sp. BE266]|uniref:helix-turn-helix transcriptional regulator n=1 Tax=Nocardioides sp. BE266 TaxID=2817725 RepID=UPI00286C25E6|nr:helix-turn-helix domain-containing protein [Nocardioides sp. BE266]
MNVAQAASYLGISKATLYTWRTRRPGFGPRAVKAGGALRYRLSDLEVWIEERAETLDVVSTTGSSIGDDAGRAAAPDPAVSSMSRRSHPRYKHPRRSTER